mgnify:CR=1 FL=1
MRTVHFVMQSKGGVGKSFAAWLLSQYLLDKYGNEFATFDTDTSNRTLSQFKALPVRELQLSPDNMDIDPRRFDTMMEQLLTEDKEFVIDTGSNTFNQLWKYMVENDAMRMLEDHGKRVLLHSIVVGDQSLVDTLNSLALLCKYSAKEKSVVVWLNEKYGKIEKDGKRFDQMKVFVEHEKKLLDVLKITNGTAATEGEDLRQITSLHLTFNEIDAAPVFSLMARQRLYLFKRRVFEEIARVT